MWKKRIIWAAVGVSAAALIALFVLALALTHGGSTVFDPPEPRTYADTDRLQIVTVQMQWNLPDFASRDAFETAIARLMDDGMAQVDPDYPALFVFPELLGAPLYLDGDFEQAIGEDTFAGAMEVVVKRNLVGVLFHMARFRVSPARALFLTKGHIAGRTYVETFSQLARAHGVYISAGSIPLPAFPLADDGSRLDYTVRGPEVHNVSYLFGPDGRIVSRQRKAFLTALEDADGLDLTPGGVDALEVVEIPGARIGMAICLDGFKDEAVDRLVELGADILLQPSANPGRWSPGEQENWLLSAWRQVQRWPELRCAVNPMMNGNLFDLVFEGQSAVIVHEDDAKPGLTYQDVPSTGGFLALASQPDTEEILVTILE